jgi:hypothetical protein
MRPLRSDLTVSERIKCRALRLALTLCCWGILTSVAPFFVPVSNPPASVPQAQAAAPQSVIEWSGDRLSVRLHNAPWAVVLQELERRTGVRIRMKGSLTGTLTQAFDALPLEQGLRRLFRDVNTAFLYAPGPHAGAAAAQLTQVWLVPRDSGVVTRPPVALVRAGAAEPQGAPVLRVETVEMGSHQEEAPQPGEEAAGEEEEEEEAEAETEAERR